MNLQVNLNPREIHGNWRAGYALDLHTVSSRLLPNGRFENTRTEIGEMVYQVKHKEPPDRSKIRPLAEIAAQFVGEEFTVNSYSILPYLDAVIPTPPLDLFNPLRKSHQK